MEAGDWGEAGTKQKNAFFSLNIRVKKTQRKRQRTEDVDGDSAIDKRHETINQAK